MDAVAGVGQVQRFSLDPTIIRIEGLVVTNLMCLSNDATFLQ